MTSLFPKTTLLFTSETPLLFDLVPPGLERHSGCPRQPLGLFSAALNGPLQKPALLTYKFHFKLEAVDEEPLCGIYLPLQIPIFLFYSLSKSGVTFIVHSVRHTSAFARTGDAISPIYGNR